MTNSASDRQPGYFCFDRYDHTADLRNYIARATSGTVWTVDGDSYAVVSIVDHKGTEVQYGIVFSLDRVTGLPVQLHMRVKTAYPRTERSLVTFGSVRFRHLIAPRMKGKRPGRVTDTHRKTPMAP